VILVVVVFFFMLLGMFSFLVFARCNNIGNEPDCSDPSDDA
jgi:hypothetical protein